MRRFNRVVVALAAAFALAAPTLAYAQRGGHGGGGGHARSGRPSSGARAPSSIGHVGSVAGPAAAPVAARNRTGEPIIGTAGVRTRGTGSVLAPLFFPGGFRVGYGLGFNPFFGSAAFGLGWGPWYDPFFYDPFGYSYFGFGYRGMGYGYPPWFGAPFGYGALGYGYPGAGDPYAYDGQLGGRLASPQVSHSTGTIRLKVSPETAQVYIDGVLVGSASEFDGLVGHHLVLEVGTHALELRADGRETFHDTITVEANKTLTERTTLNKTK